jgi:hypothetical protein
VKIHLQSILNKYCKYINNNYNINMNENPVPLSLPDPISSKIRILSPFHVPDRHYVHGEVEDRECELTGGTITFQTTPNTPEVITLGIKQRVDKEVGLNGRRLLIVDNGEASLVTWLIGRSGGMEYTRRLIPEAMLRKIDPENIGSISSESIGDIEKAPWIALSPNEVWQVEQIFGNLIPWTQNKVDKLIRLRDQQLKKKAS